MSEIQIKTIVCGVKPKGYYVYINRYASGPKQGQVFYVGKGRGNRYKSIYKRNRWWFNVARKYGVFSQILASFTSEECSFSIETSLIRYLGKENLVNICSGGRGASGLVMPDETKIKIGNANRGRKKTPSAIEKHKQSMLGFSHSECTRKKLRAITLEAVKRRPENYGELVSIGKRHKETYSFIHKDGRTFKGTKFDFRLFSGVSSTRVNDIIKGNRKSSKGWTTIIS